MPMRLKIVRHDGGRFLLLVPKGSDLVADLAAHLQDRLQAPACALTLQGYAVLPTQKVSEVLRDGDELCMKAVEVTSRQAFLEAREVLKRAEPPREPPREPAGEVKSSEAKVWPAKRESKAEKAEKAEKSFEVFGHTVKHRVLGELEVPQGQAVEDFVSRKMKTLKKAIRKQVEYYFGDSNWAKDEYLRSLADAEGYVALENIMDFKLLKQICCDFDTIQESLGASEHLELSACGQRLRRVR